MRKRRRDGSSLRPQRIGDRLHILVTATGQIDHDDLIALIFARLADYPGDGMRAFERGDDAFGACAELEGIERFLIGRGLVFHAADIVQPAMFGANAGIIEAGRDRVGLLDLAVLVLQQIGLVTVEDAGLLF